MPVVDRSRPRAFDVPVLLMGGGRSPASGRAPADVPASVLPRATRVDFGDPGHMAPVTHAARVDEATARFLDATRAPS